MVLVNAVWSTLTAFSHGEVPVWANAGAASRRPIATDVTPWTRFGKKRLRVVFMEPHK